MIGDRREQDRAGVTSSLDCRSGRRRRSVATAAPVPSGGRRPPPAGDERGQQQDGERAGHRQPIRAEPHAPPRHFLLRQPVTDALPDFEAVLIAALRCLGCGDEPQRRRQRRDMPPRTARSRSRWTSMSPLRAALLVVVEDQVVFGVVLHDSPRSGSSAVRSFRTARKTLCFVALVAKSERLADFRNRSPFVVAQRERRAFERAELRHRRRDGSLDLRACRRAVRDPATRRAGCSAASSVVHARVVAAAHAATGSDPPSSWRRCDEARWRNARALRSGSS